MGSPFSSKPARELFGYPANLGLPTRRELDYVLNIFSMHPGHKAATP
jgi:hypothetical protein